MCVTAVSGHLPSNCVKLLLCALLRVSDVATLTKLAHTQRLGGMLSYVYTYTRFRRLTPPRFKKRIQGLEDLIRSVVLTRLAYLVYRVWIFSQG